jgi:hypothetical protein
MVGMAREAPSPADLQVVRELAARGVTVTTSQLESWRRAGLLPRHRRRGLGRGQGSVVDAVDPVVVESAAVLARHLRQGRDRRLAVLEWFAEAGAAAQPGTVRVPEPPLAAVREAVVWVLRGTVSHRLLELARGAAGAGEEAADALYEVAGRLLAAHPYRGSADPALVRAALEADEDVDVPDGPDFKEVVHLEKYHEAVLARCHYLPVPDAAARQSIEYRSTRSEGDFRGSADVRQAARGHCH